MQSTRQTTTRRPAARTRTAARVGLYRGGAGQQKSGGDIVKKSDEHLQFKLRIPRQLAEELKKSAERNMRSVNAEILIRLANHNN
ncbi:hypothetical protein DPT58_22995 [Salmonella enterica subsp. enterica serovar Newport]|nr:hypothetical protein [Salmonella enterica subsp. enterica serovar Newport]